MKTPEKKWRIQRIQLGMRPVRSLTFLRLTSNVYAINTEDGFVLFDCGPEETTSTLVSGLKNRPVRRIYLTHGHADHAGSCQYWMNSGSKVFAPEAESHMVRDGGLETVPDAFRYPGFEPKETLTPGDTVPVHKDLRFKVLRTPGHTNGSVCYYEQNENLLICGDLLFGPFWRYKFTFVLQILTAMSQPRDELVQHMRSLERLVRDGVITDSTRILPGHGPEFCLEEQPNAVRRTIRWLRFCRITG